MSLLDAFLTVLPVFAIIAVIGGFYGIIFGPMDWFIDHNIHGFWYCVYVAVVVMIVFTLGVWIDGNFF